MQMIPEGVIHRSAKTDRANYFSQVISKWKAPGFDVRLELNVRRDVYVCVSGLMRPTFDRLVDSQVAFKSDPPSEFGTPGGTLQ